MNNKIKPIAIYLPQFHPIKENNEWWGQGFTEWTNVTKSLPKFKGHYQPHLPTDLGFYDLRLHDTLIEQAKLAQEHGIYGFCFYHYWFNGKLLLETPLHNLLKNKTPDFPFCLCWANENWTRRWDGLEEEVLIKQDHTIQDDLEHIKYLITFFKDDRYIKIENKPVLLVYRSELHPQINECTKMWREEVRKEGFEDIYLIRVENFVTNVNPESHGFDAAMEFAPSFSGQLKKTYKKNVAKYLTTKVLDKLKIQTRADLNNNIYDYRDLIDLMTNRPVPTYKRFRAICPGWDNSARRKSNATIFINSSPKSYSVWLKDIIDYTKENFSDGEQLFFINAWNEWAEGCHLEPCIKWGKAYLEETKKVVESR
ncbi:glycoside hydrolase family 99-like domain-containing protein [Solitalea canadensis]|uniref:Glycosyl hydrolase n=1 Tax=Solitalea canadensis (strain ATCC 29591 / DSM 3403 / JCM 21819 / LMG 8368 / NBRC 15130 / NCIMB 12057 / USAM 9D) TaxID=929556 RepID=H8KXF9_SOLCM|nr:glycoside hydrolase family 99-like domain-containing protein [Solitalea canadensis]AFD08488.1 hypothetical protein Solca_3483 [Solitalea canadensis DSM 3403]